MPIGSFEAKYFPTIHKSSALNEVFCMINFSFYQALVYVNELVIMLQ